METYNRDQIEQQYAIGEGGVDVGGAIIWKRLHQASRKRSVMVMGGRESDDGRYFR